jgi:hypothetical protein
MPTSNSNARARSLVEFLTQVVTGTLIFAVIAGAASALGWMVDFLRSANYPHLITSALGLAEQTIFGLDIVLLVIFLVRSAISLVRALRS